MLQKWNGKLWCKRVFKELFNPTKGRSIAMLAYVLIVLVMLGMSGALAFIIEPLDTLKFHIGKSQTSLLSVIKGVIALVMLFWSGGVIARLLDHWLEYMHFRVSNRALIIKAFQVIIYFFFFLIGLDVIGLDLKALAIFSGAIGIGIGFGLQKLASNFISGLVLLFEKSVEAGDLIELTDGTSGFVRATGARYTRVEMFDGKELMIPNEDFITQRVINCTYSNMRGRVQIKIGTAYDSDIELVRKLMLEAAVEHPKVLKEPAPFCILEEFGESSINFMLYFWVDDVTQGRLEPKSDVQREIWHKFKANGISIPFPQREVRITQPVEFIMKGTS